MRRIILLALAVILIGPAIHTSGLAAAPASSVASLRPVITPTPSPTSSVSQRLQPTIIATHATKRTAPALGNSLSIPSLGFRGPIVDVGVTPDNAIDVPAGLQIGRWNRSAAPGYPGAVFLDGHVDGIFAHLHRLGIGQMVSIDYEGRTFNYRVVHAEVVPLDGIDMRIPLSVYGGGAEGLNIMTCAGTFIPSINTYDKRLVVYAIRV